MKKMRIIGLMIALSLTLNHVFGQGDMENLIKGSTADANYLIEGYTAPFVKAFASGLNQGWYNTAKTHKFPGVDLTMSVSLVTVPSSDKVFKVDPNKLDQLQVNSPSNGEIPTIFGDNTVPKLAFQSSPTVEFDGPPGADLPVSKVPIPVLNLGIGLPKGFDLKIRYIPTIDLGGTGELSLFGIGIMHDIKQYIPGIKTLPFDLSAFVGYTKFKTKISLDDADPSLVSNFNVSATTIQAVISKKIAVLTVYGGVGYDIGKGTLDMKGSYDIDGDGTSTNNIVDPIDLSVSSSSPRVTGGLRLKLGPITFHGDYTLRKYSAITAGFGISVR